MIFDIDGESYLYRFWNDKEEVIYVGQSKNIYKRFTTHNHLPDECYNSIAFIDYVILPDADVAKYEKYYIKTLRPKYNQVHKPPEWKKEELTTLPELDFRPFKETIGFTVDWDSPSTKIDFSKLSDAYFYIENEETGKHIAIKYTEYQEATKEELLKIIEWLYDPNTKDYNFNIGKAA
jgi:Nuclease subunit of the excinuclease complex